MAETTYGPVDLVEVGFPTERIPPAVVDAMREIVASGVVTLLDLLVVRRGEDGGIVLIEAEDLGDELDLTEIELPASGLTGDEDIEELVEAIEAGASALVMVLEHTWSRRLVAAAADAGAVVLASERIPAEAVNEIVALAEEPA
jgi:uncharacterized membrane protein